MITELTKSQTDRFEEFVDRWTRIGLSTEPADRKRTEKGIALAYRTSGLNSPRIVWCGSQLANAICRSIIMSDKKASVRDSVRASVRASVRDSVRASVRASVQASVGDSVWDSVGASIRDSVGASV